MIDINQIARFITEDPDVFCENEYEVLMEVARPERTASHFGGVSKNSDAAKRFNDMHKLIGPYQLKRAKQWLDPNYSGREVYRKLLFKDGPPGANNWENMDDEGKKRAVSVEMGKIQKKHEYAVEVNKINDDLKEKLGREPTVKEIDEIHQGGKIKGPAKKQKQTSQLTHIDTSDKLAEILVKILKLPQIERLDNKDKINRLKKIVTSSRLGHLDNKIKFKGLKQAVLQYNSLRVAA
jgi:hypothetical protein